MMCKSSEAFEVERLQAERTNFRSISILHAGPLVPIFFAPLQHTCDMSSQAGVEAVLAAMPCVSLSGRWSRPFGHGRTRC